MRGWQVRVLYGPPVNEQNVLLVSGREKLFVMVCKTIEKVYWSCNDRDSCTVFILNKFGSSSAVERSPVKRLVVGSIPTSRAKEKAHLVWVFSLLGRRSELLHFCVGNESPQYVFSIEKTMRSSRRKIFVTTKIYLPEITLPPEP
jgi:hypothetical protein